MKKPFLVLSICCTCTQNSLLCQSLKKKRGRGGVNRLWWQHSLLSPMSHHSHLNPLYPLQQFVPFPLTLSCDTRWMSDTLCLLHELVNKANNSVSTTCRGLGRGKHTTQLHCKHTLFTTAKGRKPFHGLGSTLTLCGAYIYCPSLLPMFTHLWQKMFWVSVRPLQAGWHAKNSLVPFAYATAAKKKRNSNLFFPPKSCRLIQSQ